MLTREQIEEIQAESREKGISVKRLLQEKGIPDYRYFWWKRKYRFFFYEHGSRSTRVAMGLLKDFNGAIQSNGHVV